MLLTAGPLPPNMETYHSLSFPFNPPNAQLAQLVLFILKLQSSSGRLTNLYQE